MNSGGADAAPRTPLRDRGRAVCSATSAMALLAVSLWLGGLFALGAIAAPIVFRHMSFPANADAMIMVFQRFDLVAMSCAAIVLAAEAMRAAARLPFRPSDPMRAGLSALAGALAVLEGTHVSPRIAALHAAGAVRGVGVDGTELARLHDVAEWCGKAQALLLVAIVLFHVAALSAAWRVAPSS